MQIHRLEKEESPEAAWELSEQSNCGEGYNQAEL
jgi:hypothetical protein